jgi:hypothetical protein
MGCWCKQVRHSASDTLGSDRKYESPISYTTRKSTERLELLSVINEVSLRSRSPTVRTKAFAGLGEVVAVVVAH